MAYSYGREIGSSPEQRDRLMSALGDALELAVDELSQAEAALRAEAGDTPRPPKETVREDDEPKIDPAFVGTWQFYAPVGADRVRMQFDFRADGTYSFTADNPVFGPHSGSLSARNGAWSIASPVWQDTGTYRLLDHNTLFLAGKLGTSTWSRIGGGGTQ